MLNSQKLYESDNPIPKFNSSAVTSRLGRAEPHESSISVSSGPFLGCNDPFQCKKGYQCATIHIILP